MIISFLIFVAIIATFIYHDIKSTDPNDTKYHKKQDKKKVEFYNRINDNRIQTKKKPK